MNSRPLRWLVTGISSGIGKAMAEAALERGDTVLGTVRKPEQVQAFAQLAPGRARACQVDLTERERVVPVVTHALNDIGSVDVVVNAAGYGLAGALEELDDAEIRHQMETNFFGTLAIAQAALPFMRRQRSGHVFNVSSTSGVIGYPGLSLYCASKFAVVELDGFRTNWASSNAIVRAKRRIDDYVPSVGRIHSGLEHLDGKQAGSPAKAAQAIITAVMSPDPPLRLVLGAGAVTGIRAKLLGRLDEMNAWESVSNSTALMS
jgi:nucleoside-diphosphate-sugar epimerase